MANCPIRRRAPSRGVSMAGSDAAPAGRSRKPALGRPRGPGRAALGPLCEELAGLGLAHTVAERRRPRPRKPGPWTEIAAMERRKARGSAQEPPAERRIQDVAPPGAPSPSAWAEKGKSEDRLPRAANNRGDDACLQPVILRCERPFRSRASKDERPRYWGCHPRMSGFTRHAI
jgi:hypothetical protein